METSEEGRPGVFKWTYIELNGVKKEEVARAGGETDEEEKDGLG